MRTEDVFASFRRRLVRNYVLFAIALIAAVAGTTTVLAFAAYVGNLEDAVTQAARRASDAAAASASQHQTLQEATPKILQSVGRAPVRALVFDEQHRLLGGTPPSGGAAGRIVEALASAFGLHPQATRINGGVVLIVPDVERFRGFLVRYWSIVLPVGLLACFGAWLFGRATTGRAIAPLTDVTVALRRIAEGNFEPEPLQREGEEFRALTTAYNDVARRLTAASGERRQNELRMRQFIADAGHELRTPLTIVMGYLDVLIAGIVRDADGVARIHGTMLDESRRMRALIDKLIYLARLERPEAATFARFDLAADAQRIARALAPIAQQRIRVHADGPAFVLGDADELGEALKNVVENALRYAPESAVDVTVRDDGPFVRAEVRDRGPGMNERDVAHAFDRFYRGDSKASIEGSGLGLAIAQRAVERAGGIIAIRSAPGEGTLVSFQIPAVRETRGQAEIAARAPQAPPAH